MGALTLPASGLVYIDAMTLIYTVERYPVYWPLVEPLWQAAQTGTIEIISSELTLMEVLVGLLKSGNSILEQAFEQALLGTRMRLLPITQHILRDGARLRATTKLRPPMLCTPPRLGKRAVCYLLPTMSASVASRASPLCFWMIC